MAEARFLSSWFGIMDTDSAERVLDLITDDFQISILFSTGPGSSSEFAGDRAALEGYLAQREKNGRVHTVVTSARNGDVEMVLGRVTRDGAFEASFNATAEIDAATDKARRLLICRTPAVEFSA